MSIALAVEDRLYQRLNILKEMIDFLNLRFIIAKPGYFLLRIEAEAKGFFVINIRTALRIFFQETGILFLVIVCLTLLGCYIFFAVK